MPAYEEPPVLPGVPFRIQAAPAAYRTQHRHHELNSLKADGNERAHKAAQNTPGNPLTVVEQGNDKAVLMPGKSTVLLAFAGRKRYNEISKNRRHFYGNKMSVS